MSEIVTVVAMLLGSVLMLLSGTGILRMPDVCMRLQVATPEPPKLADRERAVRWRRSVASRSCAWPTP